jgi:hypothetical protein
VSLFAPVVLLAFVQPMLHSQDGGRLCRLVAEGSRAGRWWRAYGRRQSVFVLWGQPTLQVAIMEIDRQDDVSVVLCCIIRSFLHLAGL